MIRVGWIVLSLGIWIWQQGMPRERLDGKRVRRVEIEILFEAVRVKKIIANPPGWQRGELPRMTIKLEPLPGSKNDESIILSAQQPEHDYIARAISRRKCIGTSHPSSRVLINEATRR